eukprot:TRINITY_DN10848_c0_g1_i1.p1 TRINITY_DN10848_c0_g1~~TRINITY_DN10848_c0_g1_i1.p1  ORF type:complete len:325 (+),score=75.25 TRINITY_DN10848_c0_g1_i1:74-1048(+)
MNRLRMGFISGAFRSAIGRTFATSVSAKKRSKTKAPKAKKSALSKKKRIEEADADAKSQSTQPKSVQITIDHRESRLKELFSGQSNVTFKNLDVGDVMFEYNGQLVMIIERKTIGDVIASIRDKRWREQKMRLVGHYPLDKILYLVEGKHTEGTMNQVQYHGAVLNTIFRDGIKYLRTESTKETEAVLSIIAKKLQSKQAADMLGKDPKLLLDNVEDNYLTTIHRRKKLNLTTRVCFRSQLAQIPNIGSAAALAVINKYPSMLQLCAAYSRRRTEEKRLGMLAQLPLISKEGKKKSNFGKEKSAIVYRFLSGKVPDGSDFRTTE